MHTQNKVETHGDAERKDEHHTPHIEVLTIYEACRFLRISRPTLYRLLQQRLLPGRKAGRSWRILRKSLIEFLSVKDSSAKFLPRISEHRSRRKKSRSGTRRV